MDQREHEPHLDKRVDASVTEVSTWFRAPTTRERRIAAWLFIGFGIFFGMLFVLYAGWWFRWIILALGVFSFVRGVGHFRVSKLHEDPPN